MTKIAVDIEALQLLVQEMDSGMIVGPSLAKNLRDLIADAKPVNLEHVAEMELEILSFGQCRGPVHGNPKKACDCRYCRVRRRISR